MKCPECGSYQVIVIDSRDNKDEIYRRRRYKCNGCGGRFRTYEIHGDQFKKFREDDDNEHTAG